MINNITVNGNILIIIERIVSTNGAMLSNNCIKYISFINIITDKRDSIILNSFIFSKCFDIIVKHVYELSKIYEISIKAHYVFK